MGGDTNRKELLSILYRWIVQISEGRLLILGEGTKITPYVLFDPGGHPRMRGEYIND